MPARQVKINLDNFLIYGKQSLKVYRTLFLLMYVYVCVTWCKNEKLKGRSASFYLYFL